MKNINKLLTIVHCNEKALYAMCTWIILISVQVT